eukprot:c13154_g1_i1.p1 GENE.c13154_g1_i1~~c13154_g1_i1.p1  ORF type:complete len:395 (+),score=44.52 c13154_g1_i1:52-1185(+)
MKMIIVLFLLSFFALINANTIEKSLINELETDVSKMIVYDLGEKEEQVGYLIDELIKNEVSYAHHLQTYYELYEKPLMDSKQKEKAKFLFQYIEPIRDLAKQLADSLSTCVGDNLDARIVCIHNILTQKDSEFKRYYLPYMNQFDEKALIGEKLAKNRIVVKGDDVLYDRKMYKKDKRIQSTNMAALTILPVQHIARYELTLKELLKKYKDFNPLGESIPTLENLLGSREKVLEYLNREKQKYLIEKQLSVVHNLPEIKLEDFADGKYPEFIFELDATYLSKTGPLPVHVWVFKGYVVVAKSQKKSPKPFDLVQVIFEKKMKELSDQALKAITSSYTSLQKKKYGFLFVDKKDDKTYAFIAPNKSKFLALLAKYFGK